MPEPTPVEVIREALNLVGLVPDAEDIPRAKDAVAALASLEAELAEAREALNAQGDSWWRALESNHWRHQDQALDAAMDMLLAVRVALSGHSSAEEPNARNADIKVTIRAQGEFTVDAPPPHDVDMERVPICLTCGRDVEWDDAERAWKHSEEPPE